MDHFLVPNPSIGKLIGFSKLGKPGKCTKHETSETLFCLVLSLFFFQMFQQNFESDPHYKDNFTSV